MKWYNPIEITDIIPIEKYNQFHEILCATNGRYLENPIFLKDSVCVKYAPGDYKEQQYRWNRLTKGTKEIYRKHPWWKIILRKISKYL